MPRPIPLQSHSRLARALPALLFGGAVLLWLGLLANWPDTPDGLFHLQRVRALSEAFAQGVIFPRLFPDFAFGYGYPVLNFYAPLFYYPPALLHWAGLDIPTSVRLTLLAGVLVSAVAMVGFLRALGCRAATAYFGSFVYLLFPYRIYDFFVRGALPEFAAFLWLPCVAWSTLAAAQARTPPRRAATLLAAGLCWAGLILTHNLTALLAALTLALALAVTALAQWFQRERAGLWGALLRAAAPLGLGLLLSAWYVAPALLEAGDVGVGADTFAGYVDHFAGWSSLFAWGFPYFYPPAADMQVPLPAWLVLPALCVVALCWRGPAQRRTAAITTLVVLLAAIWLTTAASEPIWRVFAPVLGRLQFPWRWQTVIAFGTSVALALLVDALLARQRASTTWIVALLIGAAIIVYTLLALPWSAAPYSGQDLTRAVMWDVDARLGQVGATWTGEFLPRWVTEQRWAIGRAPSDGPPAPAPPVAMTATLRDDGYLHAAYAVQSETGARLRFHRFYFPAWAVRANGTRLPAQPVGSLGLLEAPLPVGESTVTLAWGATPAVWLGRLLTALGWLLGAWLIWRAQARRAWALGAWGALGIVLLLGASNLTARSLPVQPLAADFGPVQLAGISAAPARAGSEATIALHWLVQEQHSDLTTFIHVLAPDGSILAQNDAPLAGIYTPAARLLPGEIVRVDQPLALPATLAPGAYTLRIGIYPAGRADAPLAPEGSATPYILAQLEVRP